MQSATLPIPSLDSWTSLFLLAAGQGIFLAVLLISQSRRAPKTGAWLGAFVLSFSILLIFYVGFWTRYGWYLPQLNLVYPALVFVQGPLLLFYLDQLSEEPIFQRWRWLHMIPALMVVALRLPFYLHSVTDIQQHFLGEISLADPPLVSWGLSWLISPAFIIGHLLLYAGLVIWYARRILRQQDATEAGGGFTLTRWIHMLSGLFSLYTLAFLSYFALRATAFFSTTYDYLISLVMAVAIYVIGYLGYRYPRIVQGRMTAPKVDRSKYRNSTLPVSATQSIARKLASHLEKGHAYRQPDLRLNDLAGQLDVSPHHLSQAINQIHNKTFNQFINEYRIREAQERLTSKDDPSVYIIDIAYQVGFNNKTTFYQAFKALTGMSPSQYRKEYKVDSLSN